ncbi:hypothetical protein H9P43_005168 [Blastocladiella emersonii ATCC 22665]|nr:hypothetical protein H9P43_005168 [Blastocladiella emersonii ATCC 22665]
MDATPPTPPLGGFPKADNVRCELSDVTAELLHELDTTLVPSVLQTYWTTEVHDPRAAPSTTAGKFTLEIGEAAVAELPCYLVMATLSLRQRSQSGLEPAAPRRSVQVVAHVSCHLDTLLETRITTVGKTRTTRKVWAVDQPAPGSAGSTAARHRPASAVGSRPASSRPKSASTAASSAAGSRVGSAGRTAGLGEQGEQLDSALVDESAEPAAHDADSETGASEPAPDVASIEESAEQQQPDDAPTADLESLSNSTTPSAPHSAAAAPVPRRRQQPQYIIEETVSTIGAGEDGEDLVESTSTVVVDQLACPGLLFSGSELVFLLLVAMHLESNALSVPEFFPAHTYEAQRAVPVTLTSDPVATHVIGGRARRLVGIKVVRESAADSPLSLLADGTQLYFGLASAAADLVAVARFAGIAGLTAEPVVGAGRTASATARGKTHAPHPADQPDFGGEIELQSMFHEIKNQEEDQLQAMLARRPELCEMLADFVRSLLVKKPDDVYAFARDYFALGGHE